MALPSVTYLGATPARGSGGPSPSIWGDCPVAEMIADGNIGYFFKDEFLFYDGAGTGRWVETQASSGSVEQGDAAGGIITMDAGATTADQGIQIQLAGESFLPAVKKTLWFEARLAITNTSNQVFAGLAVEDTTTFAAGVNSTDNHIGFEMDATTIAANPGEVYAYGEKATDRSTGISVKTPTSGATNFVNYGFKIYTNTAGALEGKWYVDGVVNATFLAAANIPVTAMTPTLLCQAEGTTQPVVTVDWIQVAQLR